MRNRLINFIILLFLGLSCLFGSIVALTKDINVNLSRSKFVIGQVIDKGTREIENVTIRWTSYKRVFYFKLNSSNQSFAIHRPEQQYQDLDREIRIGDTLKVYYRPSIEDYNLHVFQLEKSNKILQDYASYNSNVSSQTGIILFIGVVMTIGSILWYRKFNLIKFLNALVE